MRICDDREFAENLFQQERSSMAIVLLSIPRRGNRGKKLVKLYNNRTRFKISYSIKLNNYASRREKKFLRNLVYPISDLFNLAMSFSFNLYYLFIRYCASIDSFLGTKLHHSAISRKSRVVSFFIYIFHRQNILATSE